MMSVLCKFRCLVKKTKYLRDTLHFNDVIYSSLISRNLCTYVEQQQSKSKTLVKLSLIGAAIGSVVGASYAFKKVNEARQKVPLIGTEIINNKLKFKPDIQPSRTIISPVDTTGLELTLFQYQSCPFCCKVRVLLDYYGLSYDIVEVDPVLKGQISWSSYKKVPILLAKVDKEYQPLEDSSMIMSLITSYLHDTSAKIDELATFYPLIVTQDEAGNFKNDIVNKYFIMYHTTKPRDKTLKELADERYWRKWADNVFIHTISPNIYRTFGESLQTFKMFSKVGQWEEYFPAWERSIMINVGALAMWLVSKKLRQKHKIKENVRTSLYDEIRFWLKGIKAGGGTFMGGDNPDLSDLSVYGILNSIESCEAFTDAMNNTNLQKWYYAVKEKVNSHAGSVYLNS